MPKLRRTSRRWIFRGGRPSPIASLLNRATAIAAAAGLSPRRLITLEVRGRRTGRVISLPAVVADYEGQRYLVAMLGNDTNWVRNARADDGRAVLRHRQRETVRLEELDPSKRAPILRRYLELAPGGRAHFPIDRHAPLPEFQLITAHYPVFGIRTA